jgi:hypothetical protein
MTLMIGLPAQARLALSGKLSDILSAADREECLFDTYTAQRNCLHLVVSWRHFISEPALDGGVALRSRGYTSDQVQLKPLSRMDRIQMTASFALLKHAQRPILTC